MKLPAFYVLDAISKNVTNPYASKFSAFVPQLFLETHRQVDPQTRSKMEEMLVTWRTGGPNQKELFGVAAQVSIERAIWGNDSSSVTDLVRILHILLNKHQLNICLVFTSSSRASCLIIQISGSC